MSKRSKAARYLIAGMAMSHDEAELMIQEALHEHAHELAEHLRGFGMEDAANFIDPGCIE